METNGPSRSIRSWSRRSWASYASGVKSGTVQRTLRRKCTTAPTSKKATRSAHSRRSTTSSPADSAARRALAALRLSLTGWGPIMKSVSSRLVPGPICCDR